MDSIFFNSKSTEYSELSNFYESPFVLDGVKWNTVEHYFQAQKFNENNDLAKEYMTYISFTSTANKAKLLGNQQKHFRYAMSNINPVTCKENMNDIITKYKHLKIRHDWDNVKDNIMYKAVFAKFSQNSTLKKLLLDTEPRRLYEGSVTDNYWGIGKDRTGLNKLGQIMMKVRKDLLLS